MRASHCIHFDDSVASEERKAINKTLTEQGIKHWYDAEPVKSSGFAPAPPLAVIVRIYVNDVNGSFASTVVNTLPDGCTVTPLR